MYFNNYLFQLLDRDLKISIEETANEFWINTEKYFDYKSHISSLLLGNVQSGKTVQTLGVISKLADEGFKLFLFLTTDNVYLQQQTFSRIKDTLPEFDVIGEYDDVTFMTGKLLKPIVIVLKKNSNILRKWRNNISSSGYCFAKPIVIIDDEADASSLNTLTNKKRISTINGHLTSIKELSSSSLYIQVTATPQSILLQSVISGWKPTFVNYFQPGLNYLGGDFFYSEPKSYSIRFTKETEFDDIKEIGSFIPQGLRDSLMTFLVICGHKYECNDNTCNFLIHPSVKIADHEVFASSLGEHLNLLLTSYEEDYFDETLKIAWHDLQSSKPDITNYEDVKLNVISILEDQCVNIMVINSNSPQNLNYTQGYNIIVGGNSLGRGITLPKLQTIYYCRKSKSPQADTYWQHSRIFGYDRIPSLVRIFMPASLHKLFTELNCSNTVMINQIIDNGLEGIQLILPKNIKPTRNCVVDKQFVNVITGGVNYFASNPIAEYTRNIDDLLSGYSNNENGGFDIVSYDEILNILQYIGSYDKDDWDCDKYINCVKSLNLKRPKTKCNLIIRRNRDISKGTGTLLSPTDRSLGNTLNNDITLTLYRINGDIKRGWNNKPLWVPNIKFPSDSCFYDLI